MHGAEDEAALFAGQPPLPQRSFSSTLGGADVLDSLLMGFGPGVLRLAKGVSRSWREAARRVLSGGQWQDRWLSASVEERSVRGESFAVEGRYELTKAGRNASPSPREALV